MDQLEQIRIEKHKQYLRQTWLPKFFEKYRPYFDSEERAKRTIYRFFKKYVIPNVVNEENLDYIPGLFRVRLQITNENLFKPEIKKEEKKESITDDELVHFDESLENADINQVMKESLQTYNDTIDQVINESIKDNNDLDYDEYILNQVLMESLQGNNSDVVDIGKDHNNNFSESFYFVIDIRDYINDLGQPLYINNNIFYLSTKQIDEINKLWSRVNSLKYQQDIEYQKGLINDKN